MRVAVVGATGGIGAALVDLFLNDAAVTAVYGCARSPLRQCHPKLSFVQIDLAEEATIVAAAKTCSEGGPLDLVINTVGILHDQSGLRPEKSIRELNAANLTKLFAINTIGPALVLKYFMPCLNPSKRSVIATLSARVGSISDNALGGWYSYRASKAALNQIIRTAAIELAMRRPNALCVGLHPGTVETAMSQPFLAGYTTNDIFNPQFAAQALVSVLDQLEPHQSGRVFDWRGTEIEP